MLFQRILCTWRQMIVIGWSKWLPDCSFSHFFKPLCSSWSSHENHKHNTASTDILQLCERLQLEFISTTCARWVMAFTNTYLAEIPTNCWQCNMLMYFHLLHLSALGNLAEWLILFFCRRFSARCSNHNSRRSNRSVVFRETQRVHPTIYYKANASNSYHSAKVCTLLNPAKIVFGTQWHVPDICQKKSMKWTHR